MRRTFPVWRNGVVIVEKYVAVELERKWIALVGSIVYNDYNCME